MPAVADALRQRRFLQAREAASLLYGAGARRVWLFGSLARGDASDRRTDIDFAVEGLDPRRRRGLASRLRVLLRCKIDVVGIEDAGPALRRSLQECRRLLPETGPLRLDEVAAGHSGARPVGFQQRRLQAVLDVLDASGVDSVVDFGCGEGLLLERLAADRGYRRILGVDSSDGALAAARRRLGVSGNRGRVRLVHALATNPDPRFTGFGAAVAMEFIEHLDETHLSAFERVIFAFVRPALLVVTTPNREYNTLLGGGGASGLRHTDHRFEWTRAEFRAWATRVATRAGYTPTFQSLPPTQLSVIGVGPR